MSHPPPPGDSFTPELPPALLPHLEHLYRFVADLGGEPVEAPNTRGTGQTISAANMARGVVTGPRVNGKVLDNSGADLATRVEFSDPMCNQKVYILESRYTILTNDETPILVEAKGLFHLDPSASSSGVGNSGSSQNKRDSFSRLTYNAPANSPYSWMNSIVAIGVVTMWDGKVVNDAYRVETTGISLEDARDLLAGDKAKRSD